MGKNRYSMNINEDSFKKNLNESLKGRTNNLDTDERNYMIDQAMKRLQVESRWHDAIAKGACYLDGVRFWELVDIASTKKSPAHYFVACVCRESRA
jgi:hypothetical protein